MKQLNKLKYYSIYIIEGLLKINRMEVKSDDFIKIYNENNISITVKEKSRLFIVVSPISTRTNLSSLLGRTAKIASF